MKDPQTIINYIHETIDGRMCDEQSNCLYLASTVQEAGGGNYVEIGSLFGGTAIMASLVMKDLGLTGKVYAIDPFDGYYTGTKNEKNRLVGAEVDPLTHKTITIERAQRNAKNLGADVEFIKAKSNPWPIADEVNFAVAYIDGDHWNNGPWQDWLNLKDKVDKFIVFDNCDKKHPAIQEACAKAWLDPDWALTFRLGMTCIFQRVV